MNEKDIIIKNHELLQLLNDWIILYQSGKHLNVYFNHYKYNVIAIYGMGMIGERLFDELQPYSSILIQYCIDRSGERKLYKGVSILNPEDQLEPVDAVVVTAITYFDEIFSYLKSKIECPIISLEDIIYEMF